MPGITALLFDVGGVLMTNGWDRTTRRQAAERFQLDWDNLEERHELVVADFETGRLTFSEYLDRIVFYKMRPFPRVEFETFIYDQSQPFPDSLALARELASKNRFLMGTLNNESRELNVHRIRQFGLGEFFTVFFSSCYLGLRKPDPRIYRLAMDLIERSPGECLFIDDRPLNVDSARQVGMHAVRFENAIQLRGELSELGVL